MTAQSTHPGLFCHSTVTVLGSVASSPLFLVPFRQGAHQAHKQVSFSCHISLLRPSSFPPFLYLFRHGARQARKKACLLSYIPPSHVRWSVYICDNIPLLLFPFGQGIRQAHEPICSLPSPFFPFRAHRQTDRQTDPPPRHTQTHTHTHTHTHAHTHTHTQWQARCDSPSLGAFELEQ